MTALTSLRGCRFKEVRQVTAEPTGGPRSGPPTTTAASVRSFKVRPPARPPLRPNYNTRSAATIRQVGRVAHFEKRWHRPIVLPRGLSICPDAARLAPLGGVQPPLTRGRAARLIDPARRPPSRLSPQASGSLQAVPRSGLQIRGRSFAAALCGLAGVCLFTPTAQAGGCHAAERPAIAFSFAAGLASDRTGVEAAASVGADALPPAWRPVPCPGDSPGTPSRDFSRCVTLDDSSPADLTPAAGSRPAPPARPEGDAPPTEGRRLDRPPRSVSPRL